MTASPRDTILRNAVQFLKFGVVGASNTLVDFAVTNLLYWIWTPASSVGLLGISALACATATVNSYVLNQRFTFRDQGAGAGALKSFALVATIGLIANTSIFLFLTRALATRTGLDDLLLVNVAKLGGVIAALSITFLGYRFGVFQSDAVAGFRDRFRFPVPARGLLEQVSLLMGLSLLVRLGFLCLSTVVYGDAVNYSWVAKALADGTPERVDPFWSSLYCFWQAPFLWMGLGTTAGAITASMIPGVFLVWPVAWISRSLFGNRVAWIAGLFCVVHPRLIAFSCNGYAESFYILFFVAGTAFAMATIMRGALAAGAAFGACFGAFFAVRGEAIAAFALEFVVVLFAIFRTRDLVAFPSARRRLLAVSLAIPGALAIIVVYGALSYATIGSSGLMQKASNLSKRFSEQLDVTEAAKATYGKDGALYGKAAPEPSLSEKVSILASRYPRNLMYSLERLPGVLLSPIILFALLLPAFAGLRTVPGREISGLPLLALLGFPFLFYPLIQVEPRVFFAALIPIHVLGAAGLVAFSEYVVERSGLKRATPVLVGLCVALMLGVTTWRGLDLEREHRIHREVAAWVRQNISPDEVLVGCAYGWISNTGFLTGNRTVPRLFTDDETELAAFVREKGSRWLILYEPYVTGTNSRLAPCFEIPPKGFSLRHVVNAGPGRRAHVFELDDQAEGGG